MTVRPPYSVRIYITNERRLHTDITKQVSRGVRTTPRSVTVRVGRMRSLISFRPNSALCCLENSKLIPQGERNLCSEAQLSVVSYTGETS